VSSPVPGRRAARPLRGTDLRDRARTVRAAARKSQRHGAPIGPAVPAAGDLRRLPCAPRWLDL